jgi:hypothetical protein
MVRTVTQRFLTCEGATRGRTEAPFRNTNAKSTVNKRDTKKIYKDMEYYKKNPLDSYVCNMCLK